MLKLIILLSLPCVIGLNTGASGKTAQYIINQLDSSHNITGLVRNHMESTKPNLRYIETNYMDSEMLKTLVDQNQAIVSLQGTIEPSKPWYILKKLWNQNQSIDLATYDADHPFVVNKVITQNCHCTYQHF